METDLQETNVKKVDTDVDAPKDKQIADGKKPPKSEILEDNPKIKDKDLDNFKKYEDDVDPSTKKKMKEKADSDVDKGNNHDNKVKALMMARAIIATNDKVDTPIPLLLTELAPLKAMKGVKDFKAEARGNGKFEIYLIGSKIKASDYDIDPEDNEKSNEDNELDKNKSSENTSPENDLSSFTDLRDKKIESVESDEMKNVMRQLYKKKGDGAEGKIIGDGSSMDALKNEIATGLPTNGKWHDSKLMEQKASLENLLNNKRIIKEDPISGRKLKKKEQYTASLNDNDRIVAQELLEEINNVLNQIPKTGLNKKGI